MGIRDPRHCELASEWYIWQSELFFSRLFIQFLIGTFSTTLTRHYVDMSQNRQAAMSKTQLKMSELNYRILGVALF